MDWTEVTEKLGKLREYYTGAHNHLEFDAWEQGLRRLLLESELGKHELIKELVDKWRGDIKAYELILTSNWELETRKRDHLINKIEVIGHFLGMFENLDKQWADKIAEIDAALAHYQKNYADK